MNIQASKISGKGIDTNTIGSTIGKDMPET